jgi:hypothetical protein
VARSQSSVSGASQPAESNPIDPLLYRQNLRAGRPVRAVSSAGLSRCPEDRPRDHDPPRQFSRDQAVGWSRPSASNAGRGGAKFQSSVSNRGEGMEDGRKRERRKPGLSSCPGCLSAELRRSRNPFERHRSRGTNSHRDPGDGLARRLALPGAETCGRPGKGRATFASSIFKRHNFRMRYLERPSFARRPGDSSLPIVVRSAAWSIIHPSRLVNPLLAQLPHSIPKNPVLALQIISLAWRTIRSAPPQRKNPR